MSDRTDLTGLVVHTAAAAPWRWVGWVEVVTLAGRTARCEHFQRNCRDCGEPFVVVVKVPAKLRRSLRTHLVRARRDDRRRTGWASLGPRESSPAKLDRRFGQLEVVRCKPCREYQRALRLV